MVPVAVAEQLWSDLTEPGSAVASLVVVALYYTMDKTKENMKLMSEGQQDPQPQGYQFVWLQQWNGNQQARHACHLIWCQQMVINIKS